MGDEDELANEEEENGLCNEVGLIVEYPEEEVWTEN